MFWITLLLFAFAALLLIFILSLKDDYEVEHCEGKHKI